MKLYKRARQKFITRKFRGKRQFIKAHGGPFDGKKLNLSHEFSSTLVFTLKGFTGYYQNKYDAYWVET